MPPKKSKPASAVKAKLSPEVAALAGEVVELRRHIHQHPEVAFEEYETAKFVEKRLKQLKIPTKRLVETGVVGLIDSGKPGPTIMLRADMDALPVSEENEHSYVSKNPGKMHACGHDAHVAMLLTTAKMLRKTGIPRGKVKLCFQPGEEGADGGGAMVKAGVLKSPRVDFAFAIHVWLPMEAGKIAALDGPCMAAVDEFAIDVIGVGGHAAYPHKSADPVVAAAAIVGNLHTVVSRNVNPFAPAVLTVASINAGTAFNIIPPKATMKGTIRTFRKDVRRLAERRLKSIASSTAKALGCRVEIDFRRMLGATVNDSSKAEFVRGIARDIIGKRKVVKAEPSMGGEDFSRYAEKAPAVFVYLGAKNPAKGIVYPHHHPQFDIDEDVLPCGVELHVRVAREFLQRGKR
jgi:amidohydrolase